MKLLFTHCNQPIHNFPSIKPFLNRYSIHGLLSVEAQLGHHDFVRKLEELMLPFIVKKHQYTEGRFSTCFLAQLEGINSLQFSSKITLLSSSLHGRRKRLITQQHIFLQPHLSYHVILNPIWLCPNSPSPPISDNSCVTWMAELYFSHLICQVLHHTRCKVSCEGSSS